MQPIYHNLQPIYYNLRGFKESPSLSVFCNICKKFCTFQYTCAHEIIAYWTKNKAKILCGDCAFDFSNIIYRKVLSKNDLPINRSRFISNNNKNNEVFGNDKRNKLTYSYYFCSIKDENIEFISGNIPIIKCKCGLMSCPDLIKNYNSKLINESLNKKKYEIQCGDANVKADWPYILTNLFRYNYIKEAEDDFINLKLYNQIYEGVITDASIMFGKEKSLHGVSFKLLKQTIIDYNNLKFQAKIQYDNGLEKSTSHHMVSNENDIITQYYNITIYLFIEIDNDGNNFVFILKSTNILNMDKIHDKVSFMFPPVLNNKINGKEISIIQAFYCPCIYTMSDSIKIKKCLHNIYVYFKDGTSIINFSQEAKFSARELKNKGYIPYLIQYRPNNNKQYGIRYYFKR